MAFNDDDDAGVGYGRPPIKNQFKPGCSGNAKGRPKRSISLMSIVRKEGERKVSITENGVTKRVSVAEIATRQQWKKAAQGNNQSYKLLSLMMPALPEEQNDGSQIIELIFDDE